MAAPPCLQVRHSPALINTRGLLLVIFLNGAARGLHRPLYRESVAWRAGTAASAAAGPSPGTAGRAGDRTGGG